MPAKVYKAVPQFDPNTGQLRWAMTWGELTDSLAWVDVGGVRYRNDGTWFASEQEAKQAHAHRIAGAGFQLISVGMELLKSSLRNTTGHAVGEGVANAAT